MSRINQNFKPKTTPLRHQNEAINYIVDNTNAALFDEQGLGKTKIVIDALSISMKNELIQGALIVAPLSLVYNWEQEILKHSHLIPIILRGTKREKRYSFLTGANFYITNYEAVTSELERIKRFCKSRRIAIVLDEAARIKDPKTKTCKALFELSPFACKRVIVTGTPVANKPIDIWALFYFLDQGKLLGDSFDDFCSRYNDKNSDYIHNLTELMDIVTNNSIRRKKNDVLELPEKVYKNIYVDLTGNQLELYNKLKEELSIEITGFDGEKFLDESDNILKKLLRLTQIASNPYLVDKSYKELPAKYFELEKIVAQLVSNNEKVIIWTSFIENIIMLKSHLYKLNPLMIYGDIPIDERNINVDKFQNDEKYKILIANPSAAREGLTLTRANNAIYLDRNFNLVDYLQSQDRIHRISQNKRCFIYKILARGTIDEYIDRVIEMKADIAGFIEGDNPSINKNSIDTLVNKQELLHILGG